MLDSHHTSRISREPITDFKSVIEVVLDLAGTHETLETVREGYYGAYLSFFHSCGLIFPIPDPILEILAELGTSRTLVPSSCLRAHVATSSRTSLIAIRSGANSFLFSRWIEHPWVNSTSLGFLGVGPRISLLLEARRCRTLPGSHSDSFRSAQCSDRLTRQLVKRSSFRTSGSASRGRSSRKSPLISIHDSDDEDGLGERWPPVSLSPGSEDETVAATRKRRRSSEGALPGSSRPRFVPEGDGSLFAAQSGLISLAGRMRSAGCRLPSLASLPEKEAYAKVAMASSKVMEAFNEYVVVMEDHVVASRNEKEIESIGSEIKRLSKELGATKREGKKDAEKIEALTEDWRRIYLENEALMTQMTSKKKEVSAEIQLQEVIANIDLLNELKDGGLTVDAELARLKEMEGDCENFVASAAVPDWSISKLDLPQVG
ncbi:hypothetical protein DY000_02040910 [Brassica cretica]|uniref:DUF632 domain-containing protein n=1 Tax=Brassica cretica TaxID=69181 RepID=A0ABQ7BL33_BRACR|nr:hypothetical protein DY000_02040910 [Brassica cretica]